MSTGSTRWAIAEGYIPEASTGPEPEMTSHETACILNAGDEDARVRITVYFDGRPPIGPYVVTVPAERTRHVRFNRIHEESESEVVDPIPRGTDYASIIESDVPIVVQHTRLDSRQAELGLLTTMAHALD
ncbi:MAG: sensory rhodopsin transducer [Nitriliruptorales bacterium]|nr:sensory rhodopsin transducer [Nitriliruptorales bacterium]